MADNIQKIEFTGDEMAQMDHVAGFVREESPEQLVEEQVVIASDEPTLEVEIPQGEVIEEQEEPQLIIHDEPEIITEEEVAPVSKVSVKAYNDKRVAALNKFFGENPTASIQDFVDSYEPKFERYSNLELIKKDILSDPNFANARPNVIKAEIDKIMYGFDLDSDDPDERADAEDKLRIEAEKVKSRIMSKSAEFVSRYDADLNIDVDVPTFTEKEESPEEQAAWREAKVAEYLPEVQKFVKNGVISIKDKDGVINIPAVDINEYTNSLVDPIGFIRSIAFNPDGTPNMGKWIQFVTAAKNLNGYNSTMIKHGIALGQDKLSDKIKNAQPLVVARPVVESDGEIKSPKDDPSGFAKAIANIRPWQKQNY